MSQAYDHIAIIFNPNSTHDAPEKAREFYAAVKKQGFNAALLETEYSGHGTELAGSLCAKYRRPLLVSVSGDGGYNELINGVMQAKKSKPSIQPVVAIIAAGNANDHQRTTRGDTPLIELLTEAPKPLDLLHLETKGVDRYAHSYIGLGITPAVGIELNRHELNIFKEIMISMQSFRSFTPFSVVIKGKKRSFSSLVFANISGMAKILKLAEDSSVHDGKFDIISLPHLGTFRLLVSLLYMAIRARDSPSATRYEFSTVSTLDIQLDGEIEHLKANSVVKITAHKAAVSSLY